MCTFILNEPFIASIPVCGHTNTSLKQCKTSNLHMLWYAEGIDREDREELILLSIFGLDFSSEHPFIHCSYTSTSAVQQFHLAAPLLWPSSCSSSFSLLLLDSSTQELISLDRKYQHINVFLNVFNKKVSHWLSPNFCVESYTQYMIQVYYIQYIILYVTLALGQMLSSLLNRHGLQFLLLKNTTLPFHLFLFYPVHPVLWSEQITCK